MLHMALIRNIIQVHHLIWGAIPKIFLQLLKNYYRQDSQEFWIKKILDLLDKRNVSFYLVLMPVKKIYREAAYSHGFNFDEVYQLAEKLKIKCINFFDDETFMDSDFYDFDHLNFEGSKKFSEKLKNYFLLNNKMS